MSLSNSPMVPPPTDVAVTVRNPPSNSHVAPVPPPLPPRPSRSGTTNGVVAHALNGGIGSYAPAVVDPELLIKKAEKKKTADAQRLAIIATAKAKQLSVDEQQAAAQNTQRKLMTPPSDQLQPGSTSSTHENTSGSKSDGMDELQAKQQNGLSDSANGTAPAPAAAGSAPGSSAATAEITMTPATTSVQVGVVIAGKAAADARANQQMGFRIEGQPRGRWDKFVDMLANCCSGDKKAANAAAPVISAPTPRRRVCD